MDEARRLNNHYIGTEHLLLGLVREGEGIAAGVLESLGASLDAIQLRVLDVVANAPPALVVPTPEPPVPPATPEDVRHATPEILPPPAAAPSQRQAKGSLPCDRPDLGVGRATPHVSGGRRPREPQAVLVDDRGRPGCDDRNFGRDDKGTQGQTGPLYAAAFPFAALDGGTITAQGEQGDHSSRPFACLPRISGAFAHSPPCLRKCRTRTPTRMARRRCARRWLPTPRFSRHR